MSRNIASKNSGVKGKERERSRVSWYDYYHQAGENLRAGRKLVEGCVAAGRMLIELKATTPRGEWGERLAAGPVPARTARRWMQAARNAETATVAVSRMTVRELTGMPSGRKKKQRRLPPFHVPLRHRFCDVPEQMWLPFYSDWVEGRLDLAA